MRRIGRIILTLILIYRIRMVHSSDEGNTTTTTTTTTTTKSFITNETQHHLKLNDVVLVTTLAYNKSGNINALSWNVQQNRKNTSNATIAQQQQQQQQDYILIAASVTNFQVWKNGIHQFANDNESNSTSIEWDIVQLIPSTNIARAVAFSPNGKLLALGNDDGTIQIWSIKSQQLPWRLINSTKVDGKIRSISWHPTFPMLLGIAGIKFRFVILDGRRNWTSVQQQPVNTHSSTTIRPVADTYLHYIDWSPTNAFVVDTIIYEIVEQQQQQQQRNIFNIQSKSTSRSPKVSRPIALLDACRLCTLSQWSPDGRFIATAFGSEIIISQMKAAVVVVDDTQRNDTTTDQYTNWELLHNLTTVTDAYMIITSMEWSPNGKYLAVGGAGNSNLFVYNTNSWLNGPLQIPTSLNFGIDALAWRPDSQQIAIGTSRIIEIRQMQLKEEGEENPHDTSSPSIYHTPSNYPSSAPSKGSTVINDLPSSASPDMTTNLNTAGMAAIGVAAVVLSFSCVAILFLRRFKYLSSSKRKKSEKRDCRMDDHDDYKMDDSRVLENTTSEEDPELISPLDRVIVIPYKQQQK